MSASKFFPRSTGNFVTRNEFLTAIELLSEDIENLVIDISGIISDLSFGEANKVVFRDNSNDLNTDVLFGYDGETLTIGLDTKTATFIPNLKLEVSGGVYLKGDVLINGSLDVMGDMTTINTINLDISANKITLNKGLSETGLPPTMMMESGFIIERGTEDDYHIFYKEACKSLHVGLSGETLFPLTEREEEMTEGSILVWTRRIGYPTCNGYLREVEINWDVNRLKIDNTLDMSCNMIIDVSNILFCNGMNLLDTLDSSFSDLYNRLDSSFSDVYNILDSSFSDVYNRLDSSFSDVYNILDSSFSDVYNRVDVIDVSISDIYNTLDSSFSDVYNRVDVIDVSVSDIYNTLDVSFGDVYNRVDVIDVSISDIYNTLDSSFSDVYNRVDVIDVSVSDIYNTLDVSFGDVYNRVDVIDVSVSDIYNTLDVSFGDVYNRVDVIDVSVSDLYDIKYDKTGGLINGNVSISGELDMCCNIIKDVSSIFVCGTNVRIGQRMGAIIDNSSIAIGIDAGQGQAENTVAIGHNAGRINQQKEAIAVGYDAGTENQGEDAIAFGQEAGNTDQGERALAFGYCAGSNNQGTHAIALGDSAGRQRQCLYSLALGNNAGETDQSCNTIAIGRDAGRIRQGTGSIAIGRNAGYEDQHPRSIIINATDISLNTEGTERLYIKPIREKNDLDVSGILTYDASGEITNNTTLYNAVLDVCYNSVWRRDTSGNIYYVPELLAQPRQTYGYVGIGTSNPLRPIHLVQYQNGQTTMAFQQFDTTVNQANVLSFRDASFIETGAIAFGRPVPGDVSRNRIGFFTRSREFNGVMTENVSVDGITLKVRKIASFIESDAVDISDNVIIRGTLDMCCNTVIDVSGIYFCDGTYIGHGESFDISANQVLVLSGVQDACGNYNGASIVTKDRIYQELNPDASWNSVNGYYGLAKDVYPALNPYSSGDKAVSTWDSRKNPVDNNWGSVCWSPELGIFVAIGRTGTLNRCMTSLDGINWTIQTTPVGAENTWNCVVWSPELEIFVAVASTGIDRVMTSPDGITWTTRTTGILLTNCNNGIGNEITCDDTTGLVVGMEINISSGSGTIPSSTTIASIDSLTSFTTNNTTSGLSNTILSANNQLFGLCWSPELGIFVATAITGTDNRILTSPDGITWTYQTTPADYQWINVCWSAELGLFVAVSITGTTDGVMTSPDGITWTLRTTIDRQWRCVCWSPELGIFVAIAQQTTGKPASVMTSPDGINWTITFTPANNSWNWVVWSPELSLFVAVSQSGTLNRIMSSPNGINWSTRTPPADNQWRSICWSSELGIFVAVAQNGTLDRVMTSSLAGRPPTSYNVFDSSFNNIDSSGNWTLKVKELYSDSNVNIKGNLSIVGIDTVKFDINDNDLNDFDILLDNINKESDLLDVSGGSKWSGFVMNSNNIIYGIPSNANKIIVFDPISKNVEYLDLSGIDPSLNINLGNKWIGGAISPTGILVGAPFSYNKILMVDTNTNDISTVSIPEDILNDATGTNSRWNTVGTTPNNSLFYFCPGRSRRVLTFDYNTFDVSSILLPSDISGITGTKYNATVLGTNKNMYMFPRDSSNVLIIDTLMNDVSYVNIPIIPNEDGSMNNLYYGGVLANNKKIYTIPLLNRNILEFDPSDNTFDFIQLPLSPLVQFNPPVFNWVNGILGRNGNIYGIPFNGNVVLEFNPETREINYLKIPSKIIGATKYFGGIMGPDNNIYCVPRTEDNILEIEFVQKFKYTSWMLSSYFNRC
jgi:hypothetical protein